MSSSQYIFFYVSIPSDTKQPLNIPCCWCALESFESLEFIFESSREGKSSRTKIIFPTKNIKSHALVATIIIRLVRHSVVVVNVIFGLLDIIILFIITSHQLLTVRRSGRVLMIKLIVGLSLIESLLFLCFNIKWFFSFMCISTNKGIEIWSSNHIVRLFHRAIKLAPNCKKSYKLKTDGEKKNEIIKFNHL